MIAFSDAALYGGPMALIGAVLYLIVGPKRRRTQAADEPTTRVSESLEVQGDHHLADITRSPSSSSDEIEDFR